MPGFTAAPAPSAGTGPNDVARDGYGRYLIPRYPLDRPMQPGEEPIKGEGMAQPWTRVSTLAKTVQDNYGLGVWQQRMVVKGMSVRPDLYALAAATRLEDKSTLDSIAEQAKDAANIKASANLGTALHAFTDQVDAGEDVTVPAPWDADVAAYKAALARYEIALMPGHQEVRVVDPSLADGKAAGVAGTFDRIVMWRGRPTVADLKTGTDPLKYGAGEISIQLGRYAKAWAMWDGEFFRPMPADLRTDVALVIHLAAGTGVCEVYEVDLNPGHEATKLCMAVRYWRNEAKGIYSKLGVVVADPARTEPVSTVSTAGQAALPAAIGTVVVEPDEENATAKVDGVPQLAPGKKACSVCRQPGHRKGSPKCPGAASTDPVEPVVDAVEKMEAACSHSEGFTRDAMTGVWVCAACGQETPRAEEARLAREAMEGTKAADVQEAAERSQEQAPEPEDDPFADDATPTQETWEQRIAAAGSKADIRTIREEAKAAGAWTEALLQVALARLENL